VSVAEVYASREPPRTSSPALKAAGDGGPTPRVLILGYGNPGRQDDGLGPAAAGLIDELAWPQVSAFDTYQLDIEDAMDVAVHDIVWFVDAAKTGADPFIVSELTPNCTLEFSSHLVRPETILAMAQRYFGRAPQAFLLGIRGYDFDFVEGLTTSAQVNLELAVAMLCDSLRARRPAVTS
jgi:hydrogenase maturation protease